MSWALFNKEGQMCLKSTVPILKLEEGQRVSYITDRYINTSVDRKGFFHFHYKDCDAKVEQRQAFEKQNDYFYYFEVIGTNPLNVLKLIGRIEHFIGAKNIFLGGLELPLGLPEFRSIFERLRFLWNYVIHGQTVYHSELSQEEIERQSNEAWDNYKKEEAEKEKKEIDEACVRYEEEKKKEREKEEEERNQEDEEHLQDDDEFREVNLGDSPGGYKAYE